MNEIDLVHRLRSDVPEPTPAELHTAETLLVRAIRERRRPRLTIRNARTRPALWRAAVAGAAAAVVGLALLLPTNGPEDGPGNRPEQGISKAAATILDKAADQAEQGPELNPDPRQFLQVETVTADVFVYQQQPYLHRTERTSWESVDGTRDGAVTTKVAEPQALPGTSVPEGAAEMIGRVKWHTLPACADRPEVLRTDYAHLSKLPTDAKGMLEVLRERVDARDHGRPHVLGKDEDGQAFSELATLADTYLPPAQRAALFRAAKLLSGVTVIEDAEDPAGRKGVAVARINEVTGIRSELIFDRQTFGYLGSRALVAKNTDFTKQPAGTQVRSAAQISVTVVDQIPTVPASARPAICHRPRPDDPPRPSRSPTAAPTETPTR